MLKDMQTFFKHPPDLNVFVMFKIKPEQDLICEAAGNALIFNNLTFPEKSRFRFEMGNTDTCKSQDSNFGCQPSIGLISILSSDIGI